MIKNWNIVTNSENKIIFHRRNKFRSGHITIIKDDNDFKIYASIMDIIPGGGIIDRANFSGKADNRKQALQKTSKLINKLDKVYFR